MTWLPREIISNRCMLTIQAIEKSFQILYLTMSHCHNFYQRNHHILINRNGKAHLKAFWIIGNNGLWEEWLFHRVNAFSATGKKSHLEITFMDPFSFSSIYFFIVWNLTDRSYLIIACIVTRTFQGSFRGVKLLHFIHIYYIIYHIHKYRYMTKIWNDR